MAQPPSYLSLTDDRILYAGVLGSPGQRLFGAATVYAAPQGSLSLQTPDGEQAAASVMWVPPHTPHTVHSSCGWVICLMVEPEFTDVTHIPALLAQHPADGHAWARDLAPLWDGSAASSASALALPHHAMSDATLDTTLLGAALPSREPDARVGLALKHLRRHVTDQVSAAEVAALCGLSPSRFMHLFKDEMGVGFRTLRSWKRARALLGLVSSGESLTDMAHALGYPDASHFSRSIRQITGLRPSEIVLGSRRLSLARNTGGIP
jgi:AraC-like DNA-binding protein